MSYTWQVYLKFTKYYNIIIKHDIGTHNVYTYLRNWNNILMVKNSDGMYFP